jgi:hypothetical protein
MTPAILLQGLRTLVVAGKTLEEDDWAAWDARYQQAAADLEHRDELVRQEVSGFSSRTDPGLATWKHVPLLRFAVSRRACDVMCVQVDPRSAVCTI